MQKMLLLSGSRYGNTGYLEHAIPWLQDFLAAYQGKKIAFVPYAGVRQTNDQYEQKVQSGTPYFGWSAGANMASKSIMTTNDMPITYPPSFDALNLFPYQINPHFISGKMPGHNGESREERFEEFLLVNPTAQIYAMPEGTAFLINGNQVKILGENNIVHFSKNMQRRDIPAGSVFEISL